VSEGGFVHGHNRLQFFKGAGVGPVVVIGFEFAALQSFFFNPLWSDGRGA
jgi:hypothetical protein